MEALNVTHLHIRDVNKSSVWYLNMTFLYNSIVGEIFAIIMLTFCITNPSVRSTRTWANFFNQKKNSRSSISKRFWDIMDVGYVNVRCHKFSSKFNRITRGTSINIKFVSACIDVYFI